MFSNTIRVLYLYLISFIFLMMGIGGIIFTVNATATLAFNSECKCVDYHDRPDYCGCGNEDNKNREIRAVVSSAFTSVVACGLFTFHWNAIEKERNKNNLEEGAKTKAKKVSK